MQRIPWQSRTFDATLSFIRYRASFLHFWLSFFPLLSSHVTVFLLASPLPPFPLSFPHQPPALPHVFSLCLSPSPSLFISHMNFKPWGAGGLGVSDSETRRETVFAWASPLYACIETILMQILQYVHLHANVCVCVCLVRDRDSVCYWCIRVPGTVGRVWYVALVLKGLQ